MKKGYKVLNVARGSIIIGAGGYRHYPLGKVVQPKKGCGPLAVFTLEKDAKAFSKDLSSISKTPDQIVRCVFRPSRAKRLWVLGERARVYASFKPPRGTAFALEVTCLE